LSSISNRYQPPDDDDLINLLRQLIKEFQGYLHKFDYNEKHYVI
jgi:hypothetical protein